MIDEIYNSRLGTIKTYKNSDEWEKLAIQFERSLTEDQIIMFHNLCDLQSETAAAEIAGCYNKIITDNIRTLTDDEIEYCISILKDAEEFFNKDTDEYSRVLELQSFFNEERLCQSR